MTNKEVATFYERKALHEYEKMPGYKEGRRTPASLGVFDLWVMMEDGLHLIQIKSTHYQATYDKVYREIEETDVPPYCIKELWVWYSYRPRKLNKKKVNLKGWVKYKI